MHLIRLRRLVVAAVAACLAGAVLAAPASAATIRTTTDCGKSFTYVENGVKKTGTYRVRATITLNQDANGYLTYVSSTTSGGVTVNPSWIREYVTETTYRVGRTVYLNAAGFMGTGAWVSCSSSKSF
jgi:hypothetical protein